MRIEIKRQGEAVMLDGVPCPDPSTTPSLLQGVLVGSFLARHACRIKGEVLDLGAGNQPYRPFLARVADVVVATDPTPIAGIDAIAYSESLPFGDATFDVVVATEVLEHVESIDDTIAEVARVLRPGGLILATVPFIYPIHEAPHDHRRFTHHGLRAILERHGFDVVALEAKGGAPTLGVIVTSTCVFEGLRRVGRAAGQASPMWSTVANRLALSCERLLLRAVRRGVLGRREPSGRISSGYSVVGQLRSIPRARQAHYDRTKLSSRTSATAASKSST